MHAVGLSSLRWVMCNPRLVKQVAGTCELAAAHWLVSKFVFVDMTYNHVSVQVRENQIIFWLKQTTYLWNK